MRPDPVASHLLFLTTAIEAQPRGRLRLWNALEGDTQDSRVQRALLQSVPGHPAYDPDAAREAMRALLPQSSPETAALLRARIAEVNQLGLCYRRNAELQQRLDAVTAIEEQLQERASPP